MAAYDYNCTDCGTFEVTQSVHDDALTVCPHCGGALRKLIGSSIGISFKGAGFYSTDSRQKGR